MDVLRPTVAVIKTGSATIDFFSLLFFSFSSLFLFLLSFPFVTVILELLELKNLSLTPFHSNDCKFR